MKRHCISIIGGLMVLLMLIGCNLPSNSSTPTDVKPPDAVFTAAAETMSAQLSPTLQLSATDFPAEAEQPTATLAPPTVEPTKMPESTPTSTPTEKPTPTEIPQVIFVDDFSDTSLWYSYDEDESYGFYYSDEGYHIYNSIRWGVIWSIRERTFAHVGLEVDGTRVDGPSDSYFGVVCNFSDDGENYHTLVIGDDGFFGLGLMDDGEFEFIESGMDESGAIKLGTGETNRIRGVCNGGHFLLYVNGELLLDSWDDTHSEGIIGLAVGHKSTGGRAEFRFNDFAVTYP
jgi:hypothetical protein